MLIISEVARPSTYYGTINSITCRTSLADEGDVVIDLIEFPYTVGKLRSMHLLRFNLHMRRKGMDLWRCKGPTARVSHKQNRILGYLFMQSNKQL